jgi:hypothetical protein
MARRSAFICRHTQGRARQIWKLDALIVAAGTSEEELMEDFKKLRREKRQQKLQDARP